MSGVKNEVKDREQGRDVVMSDYFKTLRVHLLQQQKRTDEKQDKVIEQLREYQLALTDGFRDLIESNRDIINLSKELPQLEAAEAPRSVSPPKPITADVDNRFQKEEKEILGKFNLPKPSDLMSMQKDKLEVTKVMTKSLEGVITPKLGGLKRRKKREEEKKERKKLFRLMQAR